MVWGIVLYPCRIRVVNRESRRLMGSWAGLLCRYRSAAGVPHDVFLGSSRVGASHPPQLRREPTSARYPPASGNPSRQPRRRRTAEVQLRVPRPFDVPGLCTLRPSSASRDSHAPGPLSASRLSHAPRPIHVLTFRTPRAFSAIVQSLTAGPSTRKPVDVRRRKRRDDLVLRERLGAVRLVHTPQRGDLVALVDAASVSSHSPKVLQR